VRTGAFEDWPEEQNAFDLVLSAEAFHWLEGGHAYRKISRSLRPGGAIALFWNRPVRSERSEGFFEAAQEVYRREAPELVGRHSPGLPRPDEATGRAEGIDESGLFGAVTVRRYPWEAEYDAAGYTRLLGTYSDHINLDAAARERLLRGIEKLIDTEFGGRVVKGYVAVLYVAHVRAGSP
jgi:SAM-dependent methyltransferase